MDGIADTALVLRRCNVHHLLTRAVVGSDNHNTGNLQRSPWSRKLTEGASVSCPQEYACHDDCRWSNYWSRQSCSCSLTGEALPLFSCLS